MTIKPYQIVVKYAGKDKPVDIRIKCLEFSPKDNGQMRPRIIFFTGFGEQRRAALRAAAQPFIDQGFPVTAIAIPFHKISLEASAWLLQEGLARVVSQINARNEPFILAGVSRGAAVAAAAVSEKSEKCLGLVMVLPHGLQPLSPPAYIRRMLKDYAYNKSFLDREARANARHLLIEASSHARSTDGLPASLRFAMDQRSVVKRGVKIIHKQEKLLAVFAGQSDRVYPPEECQTALEILLDVADASEMMITVPGGHAAVASKMGKQQLQSVAKWLRDKEF